MKLILAAILTVSSFAHARPTDLNPSQDFISSERAASKEELEGMASLSCSGGIANIGRSQNSKAVLITNGHCVSGSLRANQALINVPSQRTFAVYTNSGTTITAKAQKLIYATLTDTDMALYELTNTYEELAAMGVRSFPLYKERVPLGLDVRLTSGYWRKTQECSLERLVHKLLEGFGNDVSAPSVATNVFALSNECLVYGGYSGTPVIEMTTQTIVGLAFTGAEGGQTKCQEKSPCEEDETGKRVYKHKTSYVARVDQLAACLANGELDLTLADCTLFH